MKLSFSALCMVAGIGLGVFGLAYGVDSAPEKTRSSAEGFSHHHRDPVAAAQTVLDQLNQKLNLTASQQGAWQTYSAAMLSLAQNHAQEMKSRMASNRKAIEDMPTPERLEKMAELMRKHSDTLGKMANDVRSFYAQLTSEQKTIFDLYAKDVRHSRMRELIHARMQRG